MLPTETQPLPRLPDAELVPLLRAGHAPAFAALMRHNNRRLYRLARGVVGDDWEAEEVVQEGYVRAFTHLDSFRGGSSLATWLARIVLNEALGRLRRRHPTVDLDVAEEGVEPGGNRTSYPDEACPERAAARREVGRAIERAVDDLPAPFRAVFIMRTIEQMSIEETALCLGIPADTVKTRLYRANKLLRRALTTEFGSLLDHAFPFLGARCDRMVAAVLARLRLRAGSDRTNGNNIREKEKSMRIAAAALGILALTALPVAAQNVLKAPPGGDYKKVSTLVKLPDFLPGLGTLYVNPKTLPAGPFLAYDHQGRLVSTIYMIPLSDLQAQKAFADLPAPGGRVDHVSIYYNAGHPGVPVPHYHVVLWHVSKAQEALVAK